MIYPNHYLVLEKEYKMKGPLDYPKLMVNSVLEKLGIKSSLLI